MGCDFAIFHRAPIRTPFDNKTNRTQKHQRDKNAMLNALIINTWTDHISIAKAPGNGHVGHL